MRTARGRLAGIDSAIALAVGVPVALLVARLWVRCAAAVAAAVLDARLVDREGADAWHDATRAYVVGYQRRNGLPVEASCSRACGSCPAAATRWSRTAAG